MQICLLPQLLELLKKARCLERLTRPSAPATTLAPMQAFGSDDNDDCANGASISGACADDERERSAITPEAAAKRRGRPPLRYAEDFETPSSVALSVIGVVRSPYKVRLPI